MDLRGQTESQLSNCICNWLTISLILKSTNYKRPLQQIFKHQIHIRFQIQINVQREFLEDRSRREKIESLQKNRVSEFFSEVWGESRSSRRLILKEESRKKPWSSRCQSFYRLRWISLLSYFSKLNLYFYFYCLCFFFLFELFEAVYQLLFNLACVLDLNLEKLWISCRSCESAGSCESVDGKLCCPTDSKLWGLTGVITIHTAKSHV